MERGTITGMLLGGVIGTAAAMIFATKSGKELRKELAEKGRSLLGKANNVDTVFPGENLLEAKDGEKGLNKEEPLV